MRVCRELVKGTQVWTPEGDVRLCSWLQGHLHNVGNLVEQTMEEIWKGDKVKYLFETQAKGDFSCCRDWECPYLIRGGVKEVPFVEIDKIPERPVYLNLSYEEVCNYRCAMCYHNAVGHLDRVDPDYEERTKKIEKNLESCLPYLERIGANGCGELFASKHLLRQLANWKPLAPKEKVMVRLETNGSLFDEEHWKQIENLGQYNVTVVITVLSLDEHTYEVLSGVKYPISRIENNLRFVKSLRDKGIINHFEITTVVQERNFRTLPEWFKRCVDEFGADSVRFRPYAPYGCLPRETEFFFDIRNKNHPYHKEYLEVLKNPIFKHPKFNDWGVLSTKDEPSPFTRERNFRFQENKILQEIFTNPKVFDNLEEKLQESCDSVIVHGAGALGMAIEKTLKERGKIQVKCITDYVQTGNFLDIPIVHPNCEDQQKDLPIIVTWLQTKDQDYSYFRELGYTGKFIKLEEIFDFDKLFKDDCACCK